MVTLSAHTHARTHAHAHTRAHANFSTIRHAQIYVHTNFLSQHRKQAPTTPGDMINVQLAKLLVSEDYVVAHDSGHDDRAFVCCFVFCTHTHTHTHTHTRTYTHTSDSTISLSHTHTYNHTLNAHTHSRRPPSPGI